jgi:hypothetical protein
MTEEVISHGSDFRVTKLDRSFGGHRKTVLNINGENGTVDYNTDVTIKGQLVVNGVVITAAGAGAVPSLIYPPGEPIAIAGGTVIRIVVTPAAATSMVWTGNLLGYEK